MHNFEFAKPSTIADAARALAADGAQALSGASLADARGSIHGLVGQNGAGKSTTIRTIVGILTPDEGRVEMFGAPVNRESLRRVGYLPEERGVYRRTHPEGPYIYRDGEQWNFDYVAAEGPSADVYFRGSGRLSGGVARIAVNGLVDASMAGVLRKSGMQVGDVLSVGRANLRQPEALADLLTQVKLSPQDGEKFPHEFSGGQRQRLADLDRLLPGALLGRQGALDGGRLDLRGESALGQTLP